MISRIMLMFPCCLGCWLLAAGCWLLQTALHKASEEGHVGAILALKEVGFTGFDAKSNDGLVRMTVGM